MTGLEAADLVADWSGRLDGFCAELERQGFRVDRDGLSVRIGLPQETPSESKGFAKEEQRPLRASKEGFNGATDG